MTDKTNFDLIIIGGGPAGLTAGVYAARKQLDTLLVTQDIGGQTLWSGGIENYLGFVFITGPELVRKFEEHLRKFDLTLEFARVDKLHHSDGAFRVTVEDGREFAARATIVASGKAPRLLDVPGEKEFTGRGVVYCATCDAPLFAGMEVAVVGGGNSGLDAVIQLMKICPKVYLIEREDHLRADEVVQKQAREAGNVEIITGTAVKEIRGNDFVSSIVVENVRTGETRDPQVKGVFVEVGLTPNTDFMSNILRLNQWGEIPVDCAARTGVPGLFAAGDATDVPEKQIICAAGDGAKAALGAYSYLVRLPSADDWSR